MTATTDLDDVSAIVGAFETQIGSRTIPFAMIARFQVTEDAQARVERAFEKAVPPTLREPGVLAYQPHRDPTYTAGFVVYERWKSLDDLEAHLRTPYIAELRREIDTVITGAPEFNLLRPL
jgi:quinol monooxygenase YgiN